MPILLICAINFVSFLGVQAARIVLSLYALSLGATPSTVGGILAMLYIFPLLLSWPVGALSERLGAKSLLIFSTAGTGTGMLIPYFLPSLGALYVSAALVGLTIAVNSVIGQILVGVLSKPSERTKNFSNYSLSGSLCTFFGPILAGLSIDHFGYSSAFLTVAATFFLAVAMVLVWGKLLPRGNRQKASKGNLLHTLADRRLWKMLAISSLSQVANDIFQAFLPVYGHSIGLTASVIGTILATCAVGSFAIRIFLMRLIKGLGDGRLLAITFYWGAAAYLLIPLSSHTVTLAVIAFVFGMSLGCIQPLTMMLLFNSAEEGSAGEAIGLRLTVNNVARIIAPALFGAIGAVAGLISVFWVTAALMGMGGRLSHEVEGKRK